MSIILANFLGISLKEDDKEQAPRLTSLKGPPEFPLLPNYNPPPSRNSRMIDTSTRPLSVVRHTSMSTSQTDFEEQVKNDMLNGRTYSERPISISDAVVIEKTPTVASFARVVKKTAVNSPPMPPAKPNMRLITPPPRAMIAGADDDEERRRRVMQAMRERKELEVKLVNIERNIKKNQFKRDELAEQEGMRENRSGYF
jgi:hypothetical protein